MIDPSSAGRVASKVAELGLEQGRDGSGRSVPDGDEQARFHQAMNKDRESEPVGHATRPAADEPPAVNRSETQPRDGMHVEPAQDDPQSPGDRILHGVAKIRKEYTALQSDVSDMTTKKVAPEELLKLQMHMGRVMVNEQLIGQVGGAVEKDVDTLLKS